MEKIPLDRRKFLWTTGVGGLALASIPRSFAQAPAVAANSKLRVLSIGVVGTIGETDRKEVGRHPSVEIVMLILTQLLKRQSIILQRSLVQITVRHLKSSATNLMR